MVLSALDELEFGFLKSFFKKNVLEVGRNPFYLKYLVGYNIRIPALNF